VKHRIAVDSLLVGQSRVNAADAWGQVGNPEEGGRSPLEAVIRRVL
jgi:hypothetical protein